MLTHNLGKKNIQESSTPTHHIGENAGPEPAPGIPVHHSKRIGFDLLCLLDRKFSVAIFHNGRRVFYNCKPLRNQQPIYQSTSDLEVQPLGVTNIRCSQNALLFFTNHKKIAGKNIPA